MTHLHRNPISDHRSLAERLMTCHDHRRNNINIIIHLWNLKQSNYFLLVQILTFPLLACAVLKSQHIKERILRHLTFLTFPHLVGFVTVPCIEMMHMPLLGQIFCPQGKEEWVGLDHVIEYLRFQTFPPQGILGKNHLP